MYSNNAYISIKAVLCDENLFKRGTLEIVHFKVNDLCKEPDMFWNAQRHII